MVFTVMISLQINHTSLACGPSPGVAGLQNLVVPIHQRPVQDLAFAVARFIQKGGSYVNYYMYHGGTNFGRSAGGPFITTSYDYDAPIDEYGLIRQPKYSHLRELHKAIKRCEHALVSSDPTVASLGALQQAHVFSSGTRACAAFLANYNAQSAARVTFNNRHYDLPPWSISILPDCRTDVFNTAKVRVQTSQVKMLPVNTKLFSWESYDEDLSSLAESSRITAPGLLEQLNITRDTRSAFGTREQRSCTFNGPVNLHAGTNKIALLSVTVGLPNVGRHYETWETGITGPVLLHGVDHGQKDLTWNKWSYKVGLIGEAMNLVSPNGVSSVDWVQESLATQSRSQLKWYKAYFNEPGGKEPLALDLESMGKGQVWINGQSIGRYWMTYAKGDCNSCSYSGTFRPVKCQLGCGQPTQRWYCFSVKDILITYFIMSLGKCYYLEPLNLCSLTDQCHVQSERIVYLALSFCIFTFGLWLCQYHCTLD
ncbi:Beta-galactosidase 3 [Spatholobus suberectus]|nr:Beta-galactosidase 3 [Spatholobus suberectus]